jgi:hypothetical protein
MSGQYFARGIRRSMSKKSKADYAMTKGACDEVKAFHRDCRDQSCKLLSGAHANLELATWPSVTKCGCGLARALWK